LFVIEGWLWPLIKSAGNFLHQPLRNKARSEPFEQARPDGSGRAGLIFFITFFYQPEKKNREKKSKQMLAQNCKGVNEKYIIL